MTACYLSPIGNSTQTSTSGAPLAGGLIYTYQAGTSTPQATYMDNSGAVGQANPIVLNTYGLPSNPIWIPGGQAVKFVIKDALVNTIRTVDNVVGIDDPVPITQAQKASIPAFSAIPSATTSLTSNTPVKVTFGAKEFDTSNAFDAVNSRFQPQVPGIYSISGGVRINTATTVVLYVYKNGAQSKEIGASAFGANAQSSGGVLISMNGATDYVELWCQQAAATQNSVTSGVNTWFQGVLVRVL